MTNSFLAEFDAIAVDAFLAEGMADAAQYRSTKSAPLVPCLLIIDRTVERSDGLGGVTLIGNQIRVTAFHEHVPARPPAGAQFVVGDETFTVAEIERADESRWVCLCRA